ncbi:MAG: hypothetical protein NTU95_11360 [Methanothrix sp.]|nr:hypothetical protein [Methanothrix sp.]
MQLEDRRGLKISIAAFFFCICFFSVSIGQDDNSAVTGENSSLNLATENDSLNLTSENASLSLTTSENDSLVLVDENASSISAGENPGIKISDSLTLYSGDIITLQANDFTYLARHSARWASLKDRFESCLKVSDEPDAYSKFIVETVGNNQIQLRDADTKRYLYLVDYNGNLDWYLKKNIFASYAYVFGLPFIKIEGIRPNNMCLFKVEVINNSLGGDMIALKASNGKYLKYASKTPPFTKQHVKIITANSGYPVDEYAESVFTVTRTGVSPDYVQSISDVNFNLSSLTLSTKPSVVIELEPQENTGDSERHFTITDKYLTRKINKWAFERGIEFAIGTTISASLERSAGLSFEGVSAGIKKSFGFEVSTTITKSTKNTNEYEEDEEHEVTWTQDIPIPPHTRVSGKLIATEATVDVPFTARVYVKARNTSKSYSYPINGTYQGTRCLTVKADITEEPLNQTSAITPTVSKSDDRPIFITSNPYRV